MEISKLIKAYAQRRGLPLIPIEAKDIKFINEPNIFYKSILDKIHSTNNRLALSALYIGTGSKEDVLIDTICSRKKQNNCLKVHITLDANRATRSDLNGKSSITSLEKLLSYDQVKLTLFKNLTNNTNLITTWLSNYQKWNEISATFHSKVLVFDDDVLITGANLSDIYFDKRQDRYMVINNSKFLGDYMYNFLELINQQQQSISLFNDIGVNSDFLKDSIYDYNKNYVKNNLDNHDFRHDSNTFIIPLIQCDPAGITDKEDFLLFLDSILPNKARIYLSSGYFNPSSKINKLKLNSVLSPSEVSNGFFDGQGFLKYVPRLYTAIAKRYLDTHPECNYSIYNRPGWSYHAKGIWYEGLDDICLHVIGSSNFNHRSSKRDFETQFVLMTTDKDLMERLQNERITLWKESRQLALDSFRNLNIIYNFFARILKTFL